jgi:hypothetical protein
MVTNLSRAATGAAGAVVGAAFVVSLHLTPTPVHPLAADFARSPVSVSLTHSESYYAQLARAANAKYAAQHAPKKYAGRHRKPPAPAVQPVYPSAPTYAPSAGSAAEYQRMAWDLMAQYGWQNQTQFSCLVDLWNRESGWNPRAEEPTSGAYGIPQSLPASKMAMFGSDYLTDPKTQIEWGLYYIKTVYGDACNAWVHDYSIGWY